MSFAQSEVIESGIQTSGTLNEILDDPNTPILEALELVDTIEIVEELLINYVNPAN